MGRVAEAVAPARLGGTFRWLLGSAVLSNLADGIGLAAGPLLVASRTGDALLVAVGALAQWLPPLLFGLPAGALSDRVDRKRLVVGANAVRALVLGVLVVAVAADRASVGVVLAALFALGTAEVFVDNTAATLLPMLVDRSDLAVGNARLLGSTTLLNQLAGPPLGAALFATGRAVPFAADGILLAAACLAATRLVLPPVAVEGDHPPLVRAVVEGARWVRRNAAIRTLTLTIFVFNITFGAAFSVLVLYATRHLGLGPVGFGLLNATMAAGGVVAMAGYDRLVRRFRLGDLLRVGLVIETLTHLALATTTRPVVAGAVLFVFGAHAFAWGATSVTVRQRAVPDALLGRVTAVNTVGVYGGLVVGSTIGGALARRYDVTAPFWFAFAGSALFVVLIWRELAHVAHEDEAASPISRT